MRRLSYTQQRKRTIYTNDTHFVDDIVMESRLPFPQTMVQPPSEVKGHLCQSILGEITVPKLSVVVLIPHKTKWPLCLFRWLNSYNRFILYKVVSQRDRQIWMWLWDYFSFLINFTLQKIIPSDTFFTLVLVECSRLQVLICDRELSPIARLYWLWLLELMCMTLTFQQEEITAHSNTRTCA